MQSTVSGIKADLSDVSGDLATLKKLGATPGTDSSGTLASASKALSDVTAAVNAARDKGNAISNSAQQLATTTKNYATAHCG